MHTRRIIDGCPLEDADPVQAELFPNVGGADDIPATGSLPKRSATTAICPKADSQAQHFMTGFAGAGRVALAAT
jgi:hypothetical protein